MGWTKEQETAINIRNCNVLVSAAAGSGKTSVLINRIIERVLDPENPIDIDSIVVVTFTNAAAQEMKTRLVAAFEKKLADEPDNRHLIKQISLVNYAKISTIDKFCKDILSDYYNTINFDPSFRIADAGEISLLRADVYKELLEERFQEGREDFINLVEAFAPGKKVDSLYNYVEDIYKKTQSHPWPVECLNEYIKAYNISDICDFDELPVVKECVKYINRLCSDSADTIERLHDECIGMAYESNLKDESDMLRRASKASDMISLQSILSQGFANLKKATDIDEEFKKRIQSERNAVKKRIKGIIDEYLCMDMRHAVADVVICRPYIEALIGLVIDFTEKMDRAKTEKKVVEFADIEHLALKILINKENGRERYTEVADELASRINEIYIDEYQDSNMVQEKILTAISGERFGRPNMFMVGDVKQSIYKFRMAEPEIFMDKYAAFSEDRGKDRKIELNYNFRSCENVIDSINDIFRHIMKHEIGGIDYDDKAALHYGGEMKSGNDSTTEVLYTYKSEYEDEDIDATDIYATMAAMKIKELMSQNQNLKYKDIAILLRSTKEAGPRYATILNEYGIPAIFASTKGYFEREEIQKIMDYMRIIDNPRQEIPLASVMRSYFAYFSAEELAFIKGKKRGTELYDCVVNYSEHTDSLGSKCRRFLDELDKYREYAGVHTISELVTELIYSTGYYDYIGLTDNGRQKRANLDMFIRKASTYEKTSYSGLFNFLRYIDKIQEYEVDSAEMPGEVSDDNMVNIMSIHSSKGLEFPVVILGGASKKYNLKDSEGSLIIDTECGIGIDYVDVEKHVRYGSLYKEMIKRRIINECIGEELRLLYVALTRAIDKIIVLGIATEKQIEEAESAAISDHLEMTYVYEQKNYLSIVLATLLREDKQGASVIKHMSAYNILDFAKQNIIDDVEHITGRLDDIQNVSVSEETRKDISDKLEYTYPHTDIFTLKSKYAVSDLKHKAMEESELLEVMVTPPDRKKPVPKFIGTEEEEEGGIFRGNAYHKFFEIFDYDFCVDEASILAYLDRMKEKGIMSEEYAELIDADKFVIFLKSDVGMSMKRAYDARLLYREQPFIMEVGANQVDSSYPDTEKVLVQGIVDAFYFEGDKVYIVDYKTDRVPKGEKGRQILIERYRKQLELYAEALTGITGRKNGGCYIYSVSLGEGIKL